MHSMIEDGDHTKFDCGMWLAPSWTLDMTDLKHLLNRWQHKWQYKAPSDKKQVHLEDLAIVKKLKWYGYVTRACNIFITILQGTTIGKRRKGRQWRKKMFCWPMKCNKKQKQISFARILLRNIFCFVKELNVLQKKVKH